MLKAYRKYKYANVEDKKNVIVIIILMNNKKNFQSTQGFSFDIHVTTDSTLFATYFPQPWLLF